MKGFKQFLAEQEHLEESVLRKGMVAAYGAQGKRHGDRATQKWRSVQKQLKQSIPDEEKWDRFNSAFVEVLDGLISLRNQLGSVSGQLTYSRFLSKTKR